MVRFFQSNDETPASIVASGFVMMAKAFIKAAANKTIEVFLQVGRILTFFSKKSVVLRKIYIWLSYMPKGFPYEEKAPSLDVGSFTATLTYPLVLSWLLPVFVYNIVLEKQDKLREMMKMVSLLLICIFSRFSHLWISLLTRSSICCLRWVLKWGTIGLSHIYTTWYFTKL